MLINIKDILVLDDNKEYVVVSKINYNDIEYYYLIDKNDNSNIRFCYFNNFELIELNDEKLIAKLLPLFLKVTTQKLNL